MKKNNFETIIKPICNWTANKIREQGKVLDSRYQWQIKINQHTGIYKNRFLLNTYKEHSRGVQGRMIPGTGTPGYRPFDYLGYTKGTGILLASGNFNHSGSGENRQKKSDENDQKSHLLTFTYSIS